MEKLKPNQVRHNNNLNKLTGFFHGKYYREGVLCKKKLKKSGNIFTRKK